MPATVTTPSVDATTRAAKKHHSKKRIIRRRGRSTLDSDDEIEREAHTDSDTDDSSSYTSGSETESVSDDDEHHAGIVTPSTTQSPPPLDIPGASSSAKPTLMNGTPGPFVGTTDWAQIVADENAHGASDLPVIDFADMHTHTITESTPVPPAPSRARKAQKQSKKAAAARAQPQFQAPSETSAPALEPEATQEQPASHAEESLPLSPKAAPSKEPKDSHRLRGQSARQAYQERLQHDPAFVPRVGEFWGHDDRLLDKELRSLSGWWRGRWHSRGRGRGIPLRGRGGRSSFPGRVPEQEEEGEGEKDEEKQELPLIEQTWGHDGFEEMKRWEDKRREEQRWSQASRQSAASQKGGALRGRGAFTARGRGGFSRGGGVPATSRAGPRVDPSDPSSMPVWYVQKPEKMWTKHADNFLYFEQVARSRQGESRSIRVRLPGETEPQVVRQKTSPAKPTPSTATASMSTAPAEEGERQFVVRIPASSKTEKVSQPINPQPVEEVEAQVQELSIEEVFTVRPQVVPEHVPIQASTPSNSAPGTGVHVTPLASTSTLPTAEVTSPLEQAAIETPPDVDNGPSADIEEAVLRNPPRPEVHAPVPQQALAPDQSRPSPPALHPIQTSFSPVPQPSPSYASPYQYGTLPPGIGMSPQGYPYELATGRPVYLHPTPPPMYAPQPMMRSYMGHPSTSMPFVPGHMHHPSQEYMPHPHTPPTNGFIDPASGVPIFAPARQNSRIEIRAPDGSLKHVPRPSGLRTSTTEDEVEQTPTSQEHVSSEAQQPDQQSQAARDPAAMSYPGYQQPYYYPDPNGYPGYMDMSNQVPQYDYYPPYEQHYEQHAQPIIYY